MDQRIPNAMQMNQIKFRDDAGEAAASAAREKSFPLCQWGQILELNSVDLRNRADGGGHTIVGIGKPIRDDLHFAAERGLRRRHPCCHHRRSTRRRVERWNGMQNFHPMRQGPIHGAALPGFDGHTPGHGAGFCAANIVSTRQGSSHRPTRI